MGAAVLTIGGVQVTMIEDQFDLTNALDERQRFKCDVIDYTGTLHFQKGEQVVLTDPALGVLYSGYINSDKEVPQYPSGAILHSIDCIDPHYLADKRTYTRIYNTAQPAGKIAVDQLHDVLLSEGITQNFALHSDSTQSDFNQGILSGTVGLSNVGDGDLELAPAGSNVTITELTTADFSTGTLTNVVAANNELSATTVSGLEVSILLPTPQSTAFAEITFWEGSQTLTSLDTLNYDIWIASTSPQIMGTVFVYFSDNTASTGLVDQNNVSNQSATDLSSYAKDQWYSRSCSLAAYSGKTVVKAVIRFAGTSQGTYTLYIKNAYIGSHSGSPFFGTAATTTNVNPVQMNMYLWYVPASVIAAVLPVMNPALSVRISPSHSIDAVKLLSSSTVVWNADTPNNSSFVLAVSYDGGNSYTPCINNAALPSLPAGSNVAGLSIILKETFGVGTNPSTIPVLQDVAISLISAPNATKSDIVTNYITQAQWNTGTYTYLTATAGGDLTPGSLTRNWNDNLITNQTAFFPDGNTTQAATGGAYTMSCTTLGSTSTGFGNSRLDFCGSQILNFTLDIDMKMSNTNGDVGITFRNSSASWQTNVNNTFAYAVTFTGTGMTLYVGSNGNTDTIATLASASHAMSANTFYHLKVVVTGLTFQCYWNNESTPSINFTDNTYQYLQPGGIGLRFFNHTSGSATMTWDNLSFSPAPYGSWQSSAVSLSSLGTCGLSSIFWTQLNASDPAVSYVIVQTSVDGGTTFQTCTSGGTIPNLPSGTNVSSKSVIVNIFMSAIDTTVNLPLIRQMVWRVLGAYPGSSGTRSTQPLGNDTMLRANVGSGFGTGFDGQTYTQQGTGTTNLTSDEAQISNTTGDVHMIYGNRTGTDLEGTTRFNLLNSTMIGTMELRYVDVNNFYRLAVSPTTISLIKKSGGTTYTLATVAATTNTNTYYWARFRVVGNGPVLLYGKVWAYGVIEPGVNGGVMNASNPMWSITASD